eukprot:COSAG02_NODE_5361_length_4398_cov_2.302163_4_plen_74_part_00
MQSSRIVPLQVLGRQCGARYVSGALHERDERRPHARQLLGWVRSRTLRRLCNLDGSGRRVHCALGSFAAGLWW